MKLLRNPILTLYLQALAVPGLTISGLVKESPAMNQLTLSTPSEVIDACGGTVKVAKACLVSPQAVANWRQREQLPAHSYVRLRALLKRHGRKAPDHLWRMT